MAPTTPDPAAAASDADAADEPDRSDVDPSGDDAGDATAAAVAERARRRSTLGIVAVAAVGLLWRVAYTIRLFGDDHELIDEGDALVYSTTATNSAEGNWFQHAYYHVHFADHPPLTVASLIPTSLVFPGSVMAHRFTFCVLGAVTILLMGLFTRDLAGPRLGPVAGVAAAAVAAANPNLWMNDAVIMSESISAVLVTALMWAAIRLRRTPTIGRAAATGALCGLTILARAEIALFWPLLLVPAIALASTLPWRARLGRIALTGVTAAAVVAPWTAWNATQLEGVVLISSNDGTTLLGANCDSVYDSHVIGSWDIRCIVDFNDAQRTEERGLDASEVSALQRAEGLRHVRDNVDRLPAVLFARLGRTFGWWDPAQQVFINQGEGRPPWASWAGYGTFWAMIPPSAVGAVVLRRRGRDLLPAAAALATVVVVSTAFYGIARFRLPLDLAMCALTGVALAAAWSRLRPVPGSDPRRPASGDDGAPERVSAADGAGT